MDMRKLKKLLFDNQVYDAVQFIQNAHLSIIDACYYKDLILNVSKSIIEENEQWKQSLELEPCDQQGKYTKIDMKTAPDFWTSVFDVRISKLQFRDMLIKSFFQSCRNALDALAQAANTACLASKAKKTERVDFGKMKNVFSQQTYSQLFPYMDNWFTTINAAKDYQYINAYCNRTKHTCDVRTNLSLPLIGNDVIDTIEPFIRQDGNERIQLDRKEITEYIPKAYTFICSSLTGFFEAMEQEIPKRTLVENRIYDVSVYQEYYKERPDEGFSMAFIETDTDFNSMPNQIQVLLAREIKEFGIVSEVYAANCSFNTLYVKDISKNLYIGEYIADEELGEDSLLRFRKYKKAVPKKDDLPLIDQAKEDMKQRGVFYRNNLFFQVYTSSDDDEFIRKVVFSSLIDNGEK